MAANVGRTAVGAFVDRGQAQRAVEDLRRAGFGEGQIGVVTRAGDQEGGGITVIDEDQKVPQGAAVGTAAGAGVGALWVVGVATIGLPAVGPAVAGGIFLTILASVAGGAAVGGLLGALVGMSIPEEEARYHETEFQAGRTLAVTVLRSYRGYDTRSTPTAGP